MESDLHLLRHMLATLGYRTRRALQDAPESFGSFRPPADLRSPSELLHHMTNLLHFALRGLRGDTLEPLPPLDDLTGEESRFHELLGELSHQLTLAGDLRRETAERLLQGPFSDAMTHVGQLAMLRRLAGSPIPPENFYAAAISPGR